MLYVTLLSRCVPRIIFVACGLFLLLAAVLKTAQVGSGVGSGNDLITYRPAFITLVVFEFALGAWLVCGIYPHTARTVAILCFSIFTLASVYQAALGRVSCGCFGHFEVAPWITVLADTIATVLLSQLPPHPAYAGIAQQLASPGQSAFLPLFCSGGRFRHRQNYLASWSLLRPLTLESFVPANARTRASSWPTERAMM